MTAFGYYTNATHYVMQSHEPNESFLLLLEEAIAPLRFYLSCRVCNKILQKPMTPDHTACQHTVCFRCIGGKMRLKPSCGWCKTYENFINNKSLAVLIKCYKKLCQYIVSSIDYRKQLEFAKKCGNASIDSTKEKVAALLKEGCEAEIVTLATTGEKPMRKTGDDIVTLSTSNPEEHSSSNPTKSDLKLKLIIPSSAGGKRRRWYATVPGHPAKTSKKKPNIPTNKRQQHADALMVDVKETDSSKVTGKSESASDPEGLGDSAIKERKSSERKRCGCGNSTSSTPGKLTCYGQRCPCYSTRIPCLGCKCKGCRNPNKIVRIEQASEDTDGDEINVE